MNLARRVPLPPPHAMRPLIALVFEGLSEEQKYVPSVLLHEAASAPLHERMCAQPEYYIARAEHALVDAHGDELAALVGRHAALVEYGSGTARETLRLLAALEDPLAYVPIDLDAAQLELARREVRRRLPALQVHPLCQDYRQYVSLPAATALARRRVGYLAHSAIGSLKPLESVALLNSIRETLGSQGALVIGVDLRKDRSVLERAYDDAAGAAAAFNLNVLARLNRELDATFDIATFRHCARWNDECGRIELSLVSQRTQVPTVAGIGVALAAGEEILTAYHHAYTLQEFESLARVAGWNVTRCWTQVEHGYTLQFLEALED
jgi:dimethylhistidine N-methyltransferase